jgi:hypothetical protein
MILPPIRVDPRYEVRVAQLRGLFKGQDIALDARLQHIARSFQRFFDIGIRMCR